MVWEIGEHYPKPETVIEQGRQRLRQERRHAETSGQEADASQRDDSGKGLFRRLSQSLFGGASESSEKSDRKYDRLKRMEAYEQALAKLEDLRMTRQSQLTEISSKYARNEQRSEELRGELTFARHKGNTFMREKLEGDLSGLRAQQVHLDFDYMNILRSLFDDAISGMKTV